ncbi:TetR/AcrR family transcriptional regulator [uncultured Chitinophaga sp.]|uniref:TetR/AcrR family transcriptional regulator n=1 Tax=uncultured Chitinophaga sp. TaxID=339340 RepID=UPI00262A9A5B|nr:TetR/AcrR family transcriptional regulator [uncultured Chitinophaga sp.]
MGITERKQRQREEMRTGILDAAWKLVHEEGWQALSIRKIAEAIEYSVPVVYDHFENKDAIVAEFNKKGFELLGNELSAVRAGYREPEEQLEAIGAAYWDFAFQHKQYYQLMFSLGVPSCESARKIPEVSACMDVIQCTIRQIIEKYRNSQADPFLKFHAFLSMIHGLVSINIIGPANNEDLNRLVLKDLVTGFIKGCTA